MSDYTKGPLEARRTGRSKKSYAVIDPNGECGDLIIGGYMLKSDAVLYAAAPDLLETLISVRARFQHFRFGPDEKAVLDRVDQAIKKAKGEQP